AGGAANATLGDPSASGQLAISDVDAGEDHFATPTAAALQSAYGSTTFNATTGTSTYTLDQNLADPLTAGQHVSDTLTVASADGTDSETITVNFTDTNDDPRILDSFPTRRSSDLAGGAANATLGDPSASGQLAISDVDAGEDHFATPTAA